MPALPLLIPIWVLEGILQLVHLGITGLYEYALLKTRVLHLNLLILLVLTPLPLLVFQFSLYASFLVDLFLEIGPIAELILDIIKDSALFCGGINLFALFIERSIATLLVDRYEKMKWPLIAAFLTLAQWAGSFAIIIGTHLQKLTLNAVFGVVSGAVGISLAMFLVLPRISKRHFKWTLSREERYQENVARYQAKENVVAAQLLKRFVVLHVCLSPIAIYGYYYIKAHHSESRSDAYKVIEALYYSYVSLMGSSACVIIINSHQSLNRCVRALIPETIRKPNSVGPIINGSRGTNVNVALESQQTIHFNQLEVAWKYPVELIESTETTQTDCETKV